MFKLVLLLVAAYLCAANAEKNGVLKPVYSRPGLPEKMMIFIPGGNVPVANYMETAAAIQEAATDIRLWVVIPAVFQKLCIISCTATKVCAPLHSAVQSALDEATKLGWKPQGLPFLAGHSLGGVCANTLLQAYTTASSVPYDSLVVMGSYVDETGAHDLVNYPTPVLTLNVELDGGLARPGKTATWWRQFEAIEASQGRDKALATKPVVILPKVNHSDFCPGFNVPGDLMAEVDQATATATIAKTVAAFLSLRLAEVPAATHAEALKLLDAQTAWTAGLMKPYLAAQDMERTPNVTTASAEGSSPFCAKAQRLISGLAAADDARLAINDGFHISSPNLEHCHPNWTHTGTGGKFTGLSVDCCSHTDYYTDVDNTGSITAASEIACKMLSSARVAQQLNVTAADPNRDCSFVNRQAVEIATSMAAPSTLARFKAQGKGWCFLPDVPTFESIGPVWVFKDALALKENATCMTVASPVLKTTLDGKIYPGNHYCKFLSPARVLDWMMTDGVKGNKKYV